MDNNTSPPLPDFQALLAKKPRKSRKEIQYTKQERAVMGKYKDEFKRTRGKERDHVLRGKLLVDLFNLWHKQGWQRDEDDMEKRVAEVSLWVRNNWRGPPITKRPGRSRKRSRIDIIWREKHEAVVAKIYAMHNEGRLESSEPDQEAIFLLRTTAAKAVYDEMTVDEQDAVDRKAEEGSHDPTPPDIQQKRAKKMAVQTVRANGDQLWRDMGVYTLTFFAYTRDSKLLMDIDERLAARAGSTERRFLDMYKPEITAMQRRLREYIKTLQGEGPPHDTLDRPDLVVALDHGYPVMPPITVGIDQSKIELEALIRKYLSLHYELASGHSKHHVPFSELGGNVSRYIDSRYLPDGISVKEPRNMVKPDILAFCNHVRERQERHGVAEAFFFKRYHNGTQLVSAQYGRDVNKEKGAQRTRKQSRSRQSDKRAKLKGKQKDTQPAGHDRPVPSPTLNLGCIGQAEASSAPTRHVPVIDPALMSMPAVPANAIHPAQDTVVVDDYLMQQLVAAGHQPLEPFNGPQDGPPMYYITASTLRLLEPQADAEHDDPDVDADVAARTAQYIPPQHIASNISNRQLRPRPSNTNKQNIDPPHNVGSSARTLRSHGKLKNEKAKKKSAKRI